MPISPGTWKESGLDKKPTLFRTIPSRTRAEMLAGRLAVLHNGGIPAGGPEKAPFEQRELYRAWKQKWLAGHGIR